MSRTATDAAWGEPRRGSAPGRHRPPTRSHMAEARFEPQRTAGRMPTQRTQMPPTQAEARARREIRATKASRAAMYLFMALALTLVFLQIGQLAQMAQNTKEIASLSSGIREKKGDAGNLNMRLSMQRNIKRVYDEAVGRLGMIQPEDGQIRVISPVGHSTEIQQQTVMNSQQSAAE